MLVHLREAPSRCSTLTWVPRGKQPVCAKQIDKEIPTKLLQKSPARHVWARPRPMYEREIHLVEKMLDWSYEVIGTMEIANAFLGICSSVLKQGHSCIQCHVKTNDNLLPMEKCWETSIFEEKQCQASDRQAPHSELVSVAFITDPLTFSLLYFSSSFSNFSSVSFSSSTSCL